MILRLQCSLFFILKQVIPNWKITQIYNDYLKKTQIRKLNKNLIHRNNKKGSQLPVERVGNISPEEFRENYLRKSKPVIFSNIATQWKSHHKWNLDLIKNNYPDIELKLFQSRGLTEKEKLTVSTDNATYVGSVTGREFVERIKAGEDLYLRGSPIVEQCPELIDDLDINWLERMGKSIFGVSYQSFLGARGQFTPLHNESTGFFFVLMEGVKKWNLYNISSTHLIDSEPIVQGYNFSDFDSRSPDYSKYPGMDLIDHYSCTLNEGEILFVPAWVWHDVETLEDGWALSYRFMSLRGFFSSLSHFFVRVCFSKPSVFKTLYYSYFRTNMHDREEDILQPKVYINKGKK